MGRRGRRVLLLGVGLALVLAACGDDDGGTTAPPSTAGGATTTTQAWGEAVAPGAEAMLEGSRVLLREDFQDGDTAGWRVDAGWFILENGERRMLGAGGEAWAWYEGGLSWTRYAARLAMLVNQGSLGVSVAVSEEGRYLVHFSDAGVYLLKDAPYGQIASLGSAQPVSLGEPHVLAVGVDEGHLQVYVDGVLLIDAMDRAPLAGGSIGLGAAEGSSAAVDNIVVVSLGGPLPQVAAAATPANEPLPELVVDGAPGAGEELEESPPTEPGLPNLVVTGVSYPMVIHYDEAFEVGVSVRNAGDADAGSFVVGFASFEEGCRADFARLGAGEEGRVTCRFPGYVADGEGEYPWYVVVDAQHDVDEGAGEDDNEAAGTIYITRGGGAEELPNLAVSYTSWEPRDPQPTDAVGIGVGISQTNPDFGHSLADVGFRVFYEGGNTACSGTATWDGPEAFGFCEVRAFGAAGQYPLLVRIDEPAALAESDEDDNSSFVTITVAEGGAPVLPNVALGSLEIPAASPRAGVAFTVVVWLEVEHSEALTAAFTTRLTIDGVVRCSWDWQPGAGFGPQCDLTLSAGPHQWVADIDADDDVRESNEGDNQGWGQLMVSP